MHTVTCVVKNIQTTVLGFQLNKQETLRAQRAKRPGSERAKGRTSSDGSIDRALAKLMQGGGD